jgi:integrase
MPRRGENIYKRRDGRWEARILRPDGKYHSIYAKTYRQVREKKKNFQHTEKKLEDKGRAAPDSASSLFEAWLKGSVYDRVKPSTYENYYRCMNKYVIPFFSGSERITDSRVGQFVRTIRQSSLSEASQKKILSIFKTALREILRDSDDYAVVLGAVKMPKAGDTSVQVFSRKEQRLIENAALGYDDKRALGVLLCFYTGIRLGELCALKWCDIDTEAGVMSIVRTVSRTKCFQHGGSKTELLVGMPKSHKSIRKIPLPAFLLNMTSDFRVNSGRDTNYVLSGSDIPLDPRNYQKLFKKILKSAGVKHSKFHAIRHTFATRALELGVDIKTLSEILGHSNVAITLNVYAHSLMELKKSAMDKLNEMYMSHNAVVSFAVADSVINKKNADEYGDFQL